MAFGNDPKPTRIWSYGARRPLEGFELVEIQMVLANRYRNNLCRLDLDRREKCDNVLRLHLPGLVELETQIKTKEDELEQALDEIRSRNARARRQTGGRVDKQTTAPIRNALAELRRQRKELRGETFATPEEVVAQRSEVQRLKLIKGRAPKGPVKDAALANYEAALLHLGQLISAWHARNPIARDLAEIERWADVKSKELRHTSGLFWSNYLQVEQSCSKFGQGAPPRFRRYRGDGKIAVQLQGGLSVPEALACTDTQLRIQIMSERLFKNDHSPADPNSKRQKNWQQALVWLRIGSEGREPVWTKVPCLLKRPLPQDAVIQWAYLIRRRHGVTDHWSMQFVLARADGWPKPEGPLTGRVGVDVGWRTLEDDSLRVAYWCGSDGQEGSLVIPAYDVGRWTESDRWRGIRDREFDQMRETLVVWLKARAGRLPEALAEKLQNLPQWKSADRLGNVIKEWGESYRHQGDEMMFPVCEAWRKQDRHLHNYEGNTRAKARRWRLHLYRVFALELRRKYAVAVIENLDNSELMRKPPPESGEVTIAKARYMQRVAAVSSLTDVLESRMDVVEVPAEYTTRDCYFCGHRNEWDQASAIMQTCAGCSREWDQDRNAALNLLHHEEVEAPGEGGDPVPQPEAQPEGTTGS